MAEIRIPEEILVHEILVRLPSKSLCRFLSVCRQWQTLITSQTFISSHLNQQHHLLNNTPTTHLLLRIFPHGTSYGHEFLFYPYNPTTEITELFRSPYRSHDDPKSLCYRVIGSCNGLLCLMSVFKHRLILWNRSIQNFLTIPEYSIQLRQPSRQVFGFGVNPLDNDFKVVRIKFFPTDEYFTFSEVYSLRTGEWRCINNNDGFSFIFHTILWSQVYINGFCHWIALRSETSDWLLVLFDMIHEVFHQVLLPRELLVLLDGENKNDEFRFRLTRVVSRETKREFLGIVLIDRESQYHIWVMNEYGVSESWTKLCDIDIKLENSPVVRILSNGGIFMKMEGMQFDIFDLSPLVYTDKYVQSLALIKP